MEGVGSRLGRASARYGPTQTVFNGPVRKWKKKWVHVSSSPSSSSSRSTVSQSNGSNGNNNNNNNGSPLLLCKWTPLSNSADNNGATPEEPPKRRFRYTPIAVLEEQKKAVSEKDEDEARDSETTTQRTSESNELDIDKALTKETPDSNTSPSEFSLSLQGQSGYHESVVLSKEDQLKKSTIDDLF